ncbi:hypothetical protein PD5205_00331 [Xanthomonas fragariae]|uniref:Uncharacterized protein n=1 Tax=Xanthomonas fragariae TaxID=48664 RepID=A0A1Y6HBK4_9XANT|nr:hypothetical protein NBC2815_00242 [Xanthomonas fragariae]SMR00899.1 hypothetical protein PD885_03678 [Xanthomonas fragariae]SMR01651.1 hypothetical protein PD5205_00331 [Xanthomonas fragariae]
MRFSRRAIWLYATAPEPPPALCATFFRWEKEQPPFLSRINA